MTARRARDRARTYNKLENALKKLVCIDSDVLYWVKKWFTERHAGECFLFGAPFETDAQLVMLERLGIVDGILTCDGQ